MRQTLPGLAHLCVYILLQMFFTLRQIGERGRTLIAQAACVYGLCHGTAYELRASILRNQVDSCYGFSRSHGLELEAAH